MKKAVFTPLLCLFLIFFALSCEKVDPNPELSDEIYKDLRGELLLAEDLIKKLEAQVEESHKEFLDTPPQSGLSQVNRNKLTDSQNELDRLKQMKKFFEIKLEQRKIEVHQKYAASLKPNGPPWPDPKEVKDYKLRLKLQRETFEWNKKDKRQKEELEKMGDEVSAKH